MRSNVAWIQKGLEVICQCFHPSMQAASRQAPSVVSKGNPSFDRRGWRQIDVYCHASVGWENQGTQSTSGWPKFLTPIERDWINVHED